MKKLKKLACVLVAMTCAITGSGLMTGCKKPVANTDQTLEVWGVNAGYGTAWVTAALNEFKNQQWVKEKYPNLIIPDVRNITAKASATANDKVTAGPKANTADLIYTMQSPSSKYNLPYGDGYYLENLNEVYNGPIKNSDGSFEAVKDENGDVIPGAFYDGENYTLKDKLYPALVEDYSVEMVTGSKAGTRQYYSMPAINGWMGMVMNLTYLRAYAPAWAENLPKTTAQLLQMCEDIKNPSIGSGAGVPIVGCQSYNYWQDQLPVFWAQYEGINGYPGKGEGGYSEYMTLGMSNEGADETTMDGWKQAGRMEALKVLTNLLSRSSGNNHPKTYEEGFVAMQKRFLTGEGALMYNGDWIENEMATANTWCDDEVILMQQPVISAIVDKCSDGAFTCRYADTATKHAASGLYNLDAAEVNYDASLVPANVAKAEEQLAFVITCIDAGKDFATTKTEYEAQFAADNVVLLENDYTHIYNARHLSYRVQGEAWLVPSYANGKEVAKDFLRFIASDAGIVTSISTNRAMSPYKYVVKEGDAISKVISGEANGHASTMLKSRFEMMKTTLQLPAYDAYRPYQLVALAPLKTLELENAIMGQSATDRQSPWAIMINEWDQAKSQISNYVSNCAYDRVGPIARG